MIEDAKYPIYQFSARWTQKRVTPEDYDDTHGLPPGRLWNSTSWSRMFREDQDRKQLDIILLDWWGKYEKNGEECELFSLHAEFERRETWCLTWFCHETFDVGQTDEEAVASFRRYVRRMMREPGFENFEREGVKGFTLMSAEDEWRWRSGSDEYEGIPCRCEHCKAAGMLRIAH